MQKHSKTLKIGTLLTRTVQEDLAEANVAAIVLANYWTEEI